MDFSISGSNDSTPLIAKRTQLRDGRSGAVAMRISRHV